MKKIFIIGGFFLIAVFATRSAWISYDGGRGKAQWTMAASALSQFRFYLGLYQDDHNGKLPKTIMDLSDWQKEKKTAPDSMWQKMADRIEYERPLTLSATNCMAQIHLGRYGKVVLDVGGAICRLKE